MELIELDESAARKRRQGVGLMHGQSRPLHGQADASSRQVDQPLLVRLAQASVEGAEVAQVAYLGDVLQERV